MKKIVNIALVLGFTACNTQIDRMLISNHGPAQGSTYNISYIAPPGTDYRNQIDSILIEIDKSMSLWLPTSTISRINAGEKLTPNGHFMNVLKFSDEVYSASKGAFDVTIAPLVSVWGFGADDRISTDSTQVDSLLQYVGWNKIYLRNDSLHIPTGMKIDLNAVAQGYTVDVIADFLENRGIENYMVEVGGEIKAKGKTIDGRTWTIGIDKPQEEIDPENRYQVIIKLKDKALATSGDYRKFFVDEATGMKYSHTINPKTGYPVKSNLISVSIVADNAMAADAYATACMVLGVEEGKKLILKEGLDAYFIYSDARGKWQTWQTEGFQKMIP